MFTDRFVETAVDAPRCGILQMTLSVVRLYVRYTSAGYVMLVVELISMRACPMLLMLVVGLTMMLVTWVVLKRLSQAHGYVVSLVIIPSIHHHVVALVAMAVALVEHAEWLGRLGARRTRRRRGVCVIEGYAGASGGRSRSGGEVS